MRKTFKNDWYNQYLADNWVCVSGHQYFSALLGVSGPCALRFIKIEEAIYYLLTVEGTGTERFNKKLYTQLNTIFPKLITVVYNEDKFWAGGNCLDANGLEIIFRAIDSRLTQNKGTYKEINKTSNDSFQNWTREHLSRNCVINDIDAIDLDKKIIYELKRIEHSNLNIWKPFIDDSANYKALIAISEQLGMKRRVIAYNKWQTVNVALHVELNLENRGKIEGVRYIMSAYDSIQKNITVSNPSPYVSTNSRKFFKTETF